MTATDPDGSRKGSLQQADAPSQILDGIQLRVYHENGPLTNFNSDLGVGVGWGGSIPELKTSGKERSGWYVRLASSWYRAPCRTLTFKRPTKRWASSAPSFPEIQRASLNNWIAVQKVLSSFHRSIRAFKYFRITGLWGPLLLPLWRFQEPNKVIQVIRLEWQMPLPTEPSQGFPYWLSECVQADTPGFNKLMA